MPASLNINSYPLDLYSIVESVLLTRREAKIEPDSRAKALLIRRQIYGLKKALLVSKDHPLSTHAPKLMVSVIDSTLYVKHIESAVDPSITLAAQTLG